MTFKTTLAAALMAALLAPAATATASAAPLAPAAASGELAAVGTIAVSGTQRATGSAAGVRARVAPRPAAKGSGSGYPNGNVATAWTAACYAEFGPNASNPDPKLLQNCLDY